MIYSILIGIQIGAFFIAASAIALIRGAYRAKRAVMGTALLCVIDVAMLPFFFKLASELLMILALAGSAIGSLLCVMIPGSGRHKGIQPAGGAYVSPAAGDPSAHP